MKYVICKALASLVVVLIIPFYASTHSGGQDSIGGHVNRATGE